MLLVGAAGVVAAYIASLIVVVFVCLGAADVGPWRSVDSVPSTIDLPFPSLNNVRVQVKPLQY